MIDIQQDLDLLKEVVSEAGEIALGYYQSSNKVWMKPGDSPVSEADHAVNDFLEKKLKEARPTYNWLSEESPLEAIGNPATPTFVVDPIDGTRGFIAGHEAWCVSVAVVKNHRPVAGVLRAPVLKETYVAGTGFVTRLNGDVLDVSKNISIRSAAGSKKLNVIMSEQFDADIEIGEYIPSLAMRLAYVASGKLDVAFARSGAHDWDLAAADIVLENAGAGLIDLNRGKLAYNKSSRRAPALLASSHGNEVKALHLAEQSGILI